MGRLQTGISNGQEAVEGDTVEKEEKYYRLVIRVPKDKDSQLNKSRLALLLWIVETMGIGKEEKNGLESLPKDSQPRLPGI